MGLPTYDRICRRPEPFTVEEGKKLGWERFIAVCTIRERLASGALVPPTGSYDHLDLFSSDEPMVKPVVLTKPNPPPIPAASVSQSENSTACDEAKLQQLHQEKMDYKTELDTPKTEFPVPRSAASLDDILERSLHLAASVISAPEPPIQLSARASSNPLLGRGSWISSLRPTSTSEELAPKDVPNTSEASSTVRRVTVGAGSMSASSLWGFPASSLKKVKGAVMPGDKSEKET